MSEPADLAAALLLVLAGAITTWVVARARAGALGHRVLLALSALCVLGLFLMTVSDWPWGGWGDAFWDDNSVLSAVLSTLLLVGAGFLAFEARDNLEQQRLTEHVASAGFGGLVDHVLDLDLALALLQHEEEPAGWDAPGKPLRWLRPLREDLAVGGADPRQHPGLPPLPAAWRQGIVDQSVRRMMAGLRDWSPLLGQTRHGSAVLVRIGKLRTQLLELHRLLHPRSGATSEQTTAAVDALRTQAQVLALGLELGSGCGRDDLRAGVLLPGDAGLVPDADAERQMQELLAAASPAADGPWASTPAARVCAVVASGAWLPTTSSPRVAARAVRGGAPART